MLALGIQLDRKAPVTGNASTTPSARSPLRQSYWDVVGGVPSEITRRFKLARRPSSESTVVAGQFPSFSYPVRPMSTGNRYCFGGPEE